MLNEYRTAIFDCDGVIFDSNIMKIKAFETIARSYGTKLLRTMQNRLKNFQGESRYSHFSFMINTLIKEDVTPPKVEVLLEQFSVLCYECYLNCTKAERLAELKTLNSGWSWLVVSSSDQKELREIFKLRNIVQHFDIGIFGSPITKDNIVEKMINDGDIEYPVIVFGDSEMDIKLAKSYDFDFLFVSDWTVMKDWESACKNQDIDSIKNLDSLTYSNNLDFIGNH